jgi:hypothetical protein
MLCRTLAELLHECHTHEQYPQVPPPIEKVDDHCLTLGITLTAGFETQRVFQKEGRNASLYSSSRSRRGSGHLSRMHRVAADVRARRRAALEHGEDRFHL